MLFHSYDFMFLFLPLVLAAHGIALKNRKDRRIAVIVVASLIFYGWWDFRLLPLIVCSALFNFVVGERLHLRPSKQVLVFGIAGNLLTLAYFKYGAFLSSNMNALLGTELAFGSLLLPLAISFFTFQQISYLVDVTRGQRERCSIGEYFAFVTLFPHLIAGPIMRYRELVPQIRTKLVQDLSAGNMAVGLTIFIIGLFKKVVIADGLDPFVGDVFSLAEVGKPISFLEAWSATLCFGFRVYFDFSAYTDMATGIARMFGIRLPLNFNAPYKSRSAIEFWRRWHITLSRFLRDYLYFPLGGSRAGPMRQYTALLIVMMLGGLWHGAAWTFVIWGALHGSYLVVNHAWRRARLFWWPGLRPTLASGVAAWLLTFFACMYAWVWFRAGSIDAALNITQGLFALEGRLLLPDTYAALLEPLRALTDTIGMRFVAFDDTIAFKPEAIPAIVGALLFCLVLPPTHVLLARYRPVVAERMTPPSSPRWAKHLRMGAPAAIAVGAAGAFTVWKLRIAHEFIYFQF